MSQTLVPELPLLIVDDDEDVQLVYAHVLRTNGITNIVQCSDSRQVDTLLAEREFELILLDLNMPHVSGREILTKVNKKYINLPVIVVTGVDEVSSAVTCMRRGASDYLVKPVDSDALLGAVRRVISFKEVQRENERLKASLLTPDLEHPQAFTRIITRDRTIQGLFHYVEAVAGTEQPILITGETGVGKELMARAIHAASQREGEFVPINIAGVDDNVFSDTLFGHLRGAFTGAADIRKGLIEQAAGGTLFLDEIGDLGAMSQVKLLRLIQEREYMPLGSDRPKRTDAGIVVATNRNITDLQSAGNFREDLFFRLRAHHVNIPPLRERPGDIPLLLDAFLSRAAEKLAKRKPTVPRELVTLLETYSFPGNIRELESMCFNAVSTHKSGILPLQPFKDMMTSAPSKRRANPKNIPESTLIPDGTIIPTMKEAQAILIDAALEHTAGNQTMAADLLGITRQTLNRHLKQKQ